MDGDKNNKEGIDLSGALNDSSSRVKFEEDQYTRRSYYPETPKIIQWVMKYSGGLVKDEKQASYVLVGFAVLAIIVFLMVIFSGRSEIPPPPPTPFEEKNF